MQFSLILNLKEWSSGFADNNAINTIERQAKEYGETEKTEYCLIEDLSSFCRGNITKKTGEKDAEGQNEQCGSHLFLTSERHVLS